MDQRFQHAIVRLPGKSMVKGLTTSKLGIPNYEKALEQHQEYTFALKSCGLELTVLEADEHLPDSCFVEDVALCTPNCAIITQPGADSRKSEISSIKPVLATFYQNIESITPPGTLEAGDVMMVGDHYYIGLSNRTNYEGARQLISILENYGFTGSVVELNKVLHLKTGLAYLENNKLVLCGEFVNKPIFDSFQKIIIPEEESYAANCIWINGTVIIPKGFSKSSKLISRAGYPVIELDVSEFQKLDGGLSCLSLRF